MTRRCPVIIWLMLFALGTAPGCGWWGSDEEIEIEDDLLLSGAPIEAAPVSDSQKVAQNENEQELEHRLQVGDRFPLVKTVVQELSQESPQGLATSHSKLELILTVTVEEVREERKRLGVRYHRLRYRQDVAGEKLEFDSADPPEKLPMEVRAYHGLIENGFSFWIGPDNQILEAVGFDDFLSRCMREVPPAERSDMLARFSAMSAGERVAHFVDESIGLLPYQVGDGDQKSSVSPGHTWTLTRRLNRPTPLVLNTRYTFKELNDRAAEVQVLGNIGPSPDRDRPDGREDGVRVTVRRGHSAGSCTIDPSSGLPVDSEIERWLEMVVRLPGGEEFEQRKKTVTSIRAFRPQQATDTAEAAGEDRRG